MGCSESSNAIDNSLKSNIIKEPTQKTEQTQCYLIGQISQDERLFARVKLSNQSIDKLSIPYGFIPMNFSCMVLIEPHKYLISGGINHSLTNITSNCYIYNSNQHVITQIANMNHPRYTHASIFHSKHMYAIGGRYFGEDNVAILNSCEKYNFQEDKWISLPSLNIKRCTCFSLSWNNQIYVLGGYTGKYERSTIIERLDKLETQWEKVDFQLQKGIESGFMHSNKNNQIIIFGGNTNAGQTSAALCINLFQKSVLAFRQLQEPKMLHKSFVEREFIYIFGGNSSSLEIYDLVAKESQLLPNPIAHQFTPQAFEVLTYSEISTHVPFNEDKKRLSISKSQDEIVLIFGTSKQPFILQLNISKPFAEIYSVPLDFKLLAASGGISISNLKFIIFGGLEDESQSEFSKQTILYDHQMKTVKKLENMNEGRHAFIYERIGNKVYVSGGGKYDENGVLHVLNHTQFFDLETYKWTVIQPIPEGLISAMSLVYQMNLYVFGGLKNNKVKNKAVFKYNILKNKWQTLNFMLPFSIQTASIYQHKKNQFYLFGGKLENGNSNRIWSLNFVEQQKDLECVFIEKEKLTENKCNTKLVKLQKQNLVVILGGKKDPLTFYDLQTLKEIKTDRLKSLNDHFNTYVSKLNSQDMRDYLLIFQNQ